MKQRILLLLLAVTAMLVASVSSSHAAPATTRVVDDDGRASVSNCNANDAAFSHIQDAVNMSAPGDRVKVCPGSYAEDVVVDKALTVQGAKAGQDARSRSGSGSGESVVQGTASSDPTGAGAVQLSADDVVWDGFVVRGNPNGPGISTSATNSGYQILNNVVTDNVFGLYLNSDDRNQNIVRRNRFSDNNRAGSASGNGVYSDGGAQRQLINQNTFQDNRNAAILYADVVATQSDLTISHNVSLHDQTFLGIFASSDVSVVGNTVRQERNDQTSAIFIGARNDGVLVQGNTITSANYSGIAIRDGSGDSLPDEAPTNVDVVGNTIRNARGNGIDVTASGPGQYKVRHNTTRDNTLDGIFFGQKTSHNLISNNTSLGNGNLDCEDQSTGTGTAETADTWLRNVGKKAVPIRICRPRS
jgi:Right handed beta helix region